MSGRQRKPLPERFIAEPLGLSDKASCQRIALLSAQNQTELSDNVSNGAVTIKSHSCNEPDDELSREFMRCECWLSELTQGPEKSIRGGMAR